MRYNTKQLRYTHIVILIGCITFLVVIILVVVVKPNLASITTVYGADFSRHGFRIIQPGTHISDVLSHIGAPMLLRISRHRVRLSEESCGIKIVVYQEFTARLFPAETIRLVGPEGAVQICPNSFLALVSDDELEWTCEPPSSTMTLEYSTQREASLPYERREIIVNMSDFRVAKTLSEWYVD